MSLQVMWGLFAAHPAKLINVLALLITCPGGLLLQAARRRGAQALADDLVARFGEKRAPMALGIASLIFGFIWLSASVSSLLLGAALVLTCSAPAAARVASPARSAWRSTSLRALSSVRLATTTAANGNTAKLAESSGSVCGNFCRIRGGATSDDTGSEGSAEKDKRASASPNETPHASGKTIGKISCASRRTSAWGLIRWFDLDITV